MTADGPLFVVFAERLKRAIAAGEYPVGAHLPSAAKLSKRFEVSRNTVLSSLRLLKDEGVIRRGESTRHGFVVVSEPKLVVNDDHENHEGGSVKFSMPFSYWHYVGNKLFDAIEATFARENMHLVFNNNKNATAVEGDFLRSILDQNDPMEKVLILMSGASFGNPNVKLLSEIRKRLPVVLLDRFVYGFQSHFVGVDDMDIGYRATSHLIRTGHRRIAFVCNQDMLSTDYLRMSGYRMAIETAERSLELLVIRIRANLHISIESVRSASRSFGAELASIEDLPTGWVCSSDKEAIAVCDYFLSTGRKIPDDVSIVGCDNDLVLSQGKRYRLTTFDYPYGDIAREVVSISRLLTNEPEAVMKHICLRARFVQGTTSRREA